jgi:hypothetical protein
MDQLGFLVTKILDNDFHFFLLIKNKKIYSSHPHHSQPS